MIEKKVELLAPAGSYEALIIAFNAGADAVYLSGKSFGARAYATNFDEMEIEKAVTYAHIHKKKIYVTINTILFENEKEELLSYIAYLYKIFVDALIVQDLGVIKLIKDNYPDFTIHASTQMSIYNQNGIDNLKYLGISRAILAREVSIDTISKLSLTDNFEIEVFIHGALCYAYSGNCYLSSTIGGRSGNRGRCAQPCRKSYTLIENNKEIITKYPLLSMNDLFTASSIDKIIEAGVSSLKIEGRMKSNEYIYAVVSLYRKKIDEYYNTSSKKNDLSFIDKNDLKNLQVTFNRGFTKGFIFNDTNKNLTNFQNVNHQGILIGKVIKVKGNYITIKLSDDLRYGDGIRFIGMNETGFYVNEIYQNGNLVKFAKNNDIVSVKTNVKCEINDTVYKTVDKEKVDFCNQLIKHPSIKRLIKMELFIKYGELCILSILTDDIKTTTSYYQCLEVANKPMSEDRIKEQLSKVNDTPFEIESIIVNYDQKGYVPIKEINELRRRAIENIIQQLKQQVHRHLLPLNFTSGTMNAVKGNITLSALVFNDVQEKACYESGINNVFLNSNNERFCNDMKSNYWISNIGNFKLSNDIEDKTASMYLNITNTSSVELLNKLGFNTIYLSNELSFEQIKELTNIEKLSNLGVMVYGRQDLMITNQCLIAKAKGFTNKNCKSCLENNYLIEDEYHNQFPILTDYPSCKVHILDYRILNLSNHINDLIKTGINNFLLVFTTESVNDIKIIIKHFQHLLNNQYSNIDNIKNHELFYEGNYKERIK